MTATLYYSRLGLLEKILLNKERRILSFLSLVFSFLTKIIIIRKFYSLNLFTSIGKQFMLQKEKIIKICPKCRNIYEVKINICQLIQKQTHFLSSKLSIIHYPLSKFLVKCEWQLDGFNGKISRALVIRQTDRAINDFTASSPLRLIGSLHFYGAKYTEAPF